LMDVNYSFPQDLDHDETLEEAGQEKELYRLKLGHDIYYCRPYQAFHTQLRYNFSDLLETGVDSEYEEMVNGSKMNNNGSPGGCPSCVTVIPVCPPVPPSGQSPRLDGHDPPYENIPLHKVTISVPSAGPGLHRILPLRKSKVPLKYQGIKRVKTKTRTQPKPGEPVEKSGYSRNEVWHWLDPENGGESRLGDLYSVSAKKKPPVVRLELSAGEFLAATNRLQHLDLEGMDSFVGNTIDRAVDKVARTGRNNQHDRIVLEAGVGGELVGVDKGRQDRGGQDVYVRREPSGACQACLTGGHSSCSSALSSLESARSSHSHGVPNVVRCDSDSSAIGSMNSSVQGNDNYMRMCAPAPRQPPTCAPNMMRGRIRNSLPQMAGHKPYQTLEVGPTDSTMNFQPEQVDSQNTRSNNKLNLVDTNIQLHRQEWYHGNVSRHEAEAVLRLHPPGSYLVRKSESATKDYSLSLKSSFGFMHMRIQATPEGQYVLGQFSKPFLGIPAMMNHYTVNRLPIKGAQHMCLVNPICEQLL